MNNDAHPEQYGIAPWHQFQLDLVPKLVVERAKIVGDEPLAVRAKRLIHQCYHQRPSFASQIVTLVEHVAALGQLYIICMKQLKFEVLRSEPGFPQDLHGVM